MSQGDLFGGGRRQLPKKDYPRWRAMMSELVRAVARKLRFFTSDDVFEVAAERGVSTTRDLRAFGSIMTEAKKAGICRLADRAPVKSRRPSLHSSPREVWESLIWKGGKL
jgi:hypothetical protein